jgi:hypothetical protein
MRSLLALHSLLSPCKRNFCFVILLLIITTGQSVFAQAWTNADYKKAIWMTTRFYGGQRSGSNNWLLNNHLPGGVPAALRGQAFIGDVDGTYDISGGWHDCGDHVKFGQTQFYSAYVLLKGYSEFPAGYDDKYTPDYAGYIAGGNWTYEGTNHDPNCIPDVLDEMKHETDFLIKCTPNATTFYYQVGDGNPDHMQWVTAVKMQTNSVANGGQIRSVYKNPDDGSMPALCAATLALMSRLYQPYDAAYAATCLTHAQYAYTYAKARTNTVADANGGSFYGSNNSRLPNWATMCAELYWTTGTAAYQTEALSYAASINATAGWSFDYDNNNEIALYNLAKLGNATATTRFNTKITTDYIAAGKRNAQGVYNDYGGGWGALRYNAIASFMIALYSKLNNDVSAGVLTPLYKDIDYIMGSNSNKRSYIVGFVPAAGGPYVAPQYPHHRNVYLRDDNPSNATVLTIPAKNQQFGALVGGKRDATYTDDRSDYVNSEVCIDYNACLVGALGFINARLAPVTIAPCGPPIVCKTPNLGADLNTCSGTTLPATLNANAGAAGGAISYKWYTWNGSTATLIAGQTAQTYSAPSAGGYIVERDSTATPTCQRFDTIFITNTMTKPTLGPDPNICSTPSITLSASNAGSYPGGTTWQWQSSSALAGPYTNISGETSSSMVVSSVAYYKLIVTSGSCTSSDTIFITSTLLKPSLGADVNLCTPAFATLAASNAGSYPGGTTWQWQSATALAGPYANISGQTASSMSNVRIANYYKLLATAGSCSNSDTIRVTSGVPTPVDGCRSGTGTVGLSIVNPGLNGTNYNWYDALNNGNLMAGGTATTTFTTPSISTTTTYYVEDMSTINTTVGRTTTPCAGAIYDENRVMMSFTAYQDFTIVSIKLQVHNYSGAITENATVRIHSASTYNANILQSSAPFSFAHPGGSTTIEVTVPVNLTVTGTSPVPTTYWMSIDLPNTAFRFFAGCGSSYPYLDNGTPAGNYARITGHSADGGFNSGDLGPFYNWVISTGSSCGRLPVIATVGTCSGLPVELFSFYSEDKNGDVALLWATASETNNDYFEIQRSSDGAGFSKIGKVEGNGNSNSIINYEFTDEYPDFGTSYYRIKQVDFDGSTVFSEVITVTRHDRTSLNVAPNPFNNETVINVYSPHQEKLSLKIFDLSGREVYSGTYSTNENISAGSGLPCGVYIIQVLAGDRIYHSRMVKN